MLALVGIEVGSKLVVVPGDFGDTHEFTHALPIAHHRLDLDVAHGSVAVVVYPAPCHHREGREHVDHLVVRDVVGAVHPVESTDRRRVVRLTPDVVAGFDQDDRGVIEALLGVVDELPCPREQLRDRGHGEGVHQRDL